MIKRILAWMAIVGFIFLLANLLFFRYNIELSTVIYGLIIILFIFTAKKS